MEIHNVRLLGLTVLLWLGAASLAFAQEPATRSEADRQRREEKNRNAEPYKPGGFERAMHFVEERAIFILGREGLYPKLGSLTTGSGFAYGAGYRDRDLFNNQGTVDVWAATSLRGYWATEARLTFPTSWRTSVCSSRPGPPTATIPRRISSAPAPTRRAPTRRAMPSNRTSSARAPASALCPIVLAGGGLEYLNPRLGPGKDSRVPSIEQRVRSVHRPGPRRIGRLSALDGLSGS